MQEDLVLQFIFSNQLLFSICFGGLGGLTYAVDLHQKIRITTVIRQMIVSSLIGLFCFFALYDVSFVGQAERVAIVFLAGFYGTAFIRKMVSFVMHYYRILAAFDFSEEAWNERQRAPKPTIQVLPKVDRECPDAVQQVPGDDHPER